jgi:hypothetical protein
MVGLQCLDFNAEFSCKRDQRGLDISKSLPTIYFRFTLPQKVKVGAMQDQNAN